ncbi:MAG TPA: tryptophan--tRNA ligase [candidate division Zixibacteria bacterium]|nr:tryptophan--tRNA ligase [candidate division Zixibacteria bacterium]
MTEKKKILLSGMQPSGALHLGNYEGALRNWVELQNTGKYEMFNCIVDWHALTSGFESTEQLVPRIYEMAADYISAGLDPEKTAIFVQSQVKEHAELHLLLSMIIPTPWLERVPSYKEKAESLGLDSYGFLGYPLLQSADIIVYRADVVPVGKDQLPHLELTREVVRRFHYLYGDVFPEPQALVTKFQVLPGTDGKKMSKTYGNFIALGDPPDIVKKKVMSMFTDQTKIHKTDPGHPEDCPVYIYRTIYDADLPADLADKCSSGDPSVGCVGCKKALLSALIDYFADFRERREELLADKAQLDAFLESGADRARQRASETMKLVREAMHMFKPEM